MVLVVVMLRLLLLLLRHLHKMTGVSPVIGEPKCCCQLSARVPGPGQHRDGVPGGEPGGGGAASGRGELGQCSLVRMGMVGIWMILVVRSMSRSGLWVSHVESGGSPPRSLYQDALGKILGLGKGRRRRGRRLRLVRTYGRSVNLQLIPLKNGSLFANYFHGPTKRNCSVCLFSRNIFI